MLPGLSGVIAGLAASYPAMSVVYSATDTSAKASGPYSFAGADFGPDYPGRTLIVCAFLHATTVEILNQSSVSIGGSSGVGGDNGFAGSGAAAGAGIWAAQPTGTSGTISVDWSGGSAYGCSISIISVGGLSSTTAHDTIVIVPSGTLAAESSTLNIPANGVLVVAVCRENINGVTFTGATEQLDVVFDTTAKKAIAFDENMALQAGRTVGWTSTGSEATGWRAHSYSR